jgi:uncharacterized repeat protein (TIGR03803 family)
MRPLCRIPVVLTALSVAVGPCDAASFSVIHSFNRKDGIFPLSGVIMDGAGNLYGTTSAAGVPKGSGTVYRLTQSGEFATLHVFRYTRPQTDGSDPEGGLVLGPQGTLFGTTVAGGIGTNRGTVFAVAPDGSETVLHSFVRNGRGVRPRSALAINNEGNLFGAATGGAFGAGLVFRLRPQGEERVLYSFRGEPDGAFPEGALIADLAGNLYGTTAGGGGFSCGASDCGTVFKMTPDGQETLLYAFQGGNDGGVPHAGLVRDATGNLYGTTAMGGGTGCFESVGCGTVFKIAPDGTETVLHAFSQSEGSDPLAGLAMDRVGNLYGTAYLGGDLGCGTSGLGCGTVFEIAPDGSETTLHVFEAGADGSFPQGTLLLDASGNLYGTTEHGGEAKNERCAPDGGCGTIFKLTP